MYKKIFLGIYILISIGFGIFALFCSFEFCETLGVLIPTTPWIQLSGNFLDIDSKFVIPIFYIINGLIFFYIGKFIDKIVSKKNNLTSND